MWGLYKSTGFCNLQSVFPVFVFAITKRTLSIERSQSRILRKHISSSSVLFDFVLTLIRSHKRYKSLLIAKEHIAPYVSIEGKEVY